MSKKILLSIISCIFIISIPIYADNLIAFYTYIPITDLDIKNDDIISSLSKNLCNGSDDVYDAENNIIIDANGMDEKEKHSDYVLQVLSRFIKNTTTKCLFLKSPNDINYRTDEAYLNYAIDYAHVCGTKIFFLTHGYTDAKTNKKNLKSNTILLQTIMNKCEQYPDMLFIMSAGNSGELIDDFLIMNGKINDNLLFVGSCDTFGNISKFSVKGKIVEVYTLGETIGIYDSDNNVWTVIEGTSFATPIMAAIANNFVNLFPNITGKELKQCLLSMRNENKVILNMDILRRIYLPIIGKSSKKR